MQNNIRAFSILVVLVITLVSVNCSGNQGAQGQKPPKQRPTEDEQIKAQRDFLEKERTSIQAYIKDRNLNMQRSGTGMYYKIEKDSAGGPNATTNDDVEFEYTISLMNGSLLYSSKEMGTRKLKIDREDAEIGLHEALKKLGVGDEGLFILPSHLAFGVAGDQERVPPLTPLVYEIKVVKIQKSKSGK